MTGTDLRRRVPQPDGDDEIARLARIMNAMLDRVEDANDRQQRFVADASHELATRSPVSAPSWRSISPILTPLTAP